MDQGKDGFGEFGDVLLLTVQALQISPLIEDIIQLRLIGEAVQVGSVIFNRSP